ncbi:hypothetical protein E2C01_068611 [Portunus trituberculatus]|uniref:Uncharacterized protein n=1 Tax=Portunus trituberculatus TaxID=210409 RepID=A0A5B7HYC4_PORTR|nr:hypothetical protein [Portunus trituberculatus]
MPLNRERASAQLVSLPLTQSENFFRQREKKGRTSRSLPLDALNCRYVVHVEPHRHSGEVPMSQEPLLRYPQLPYVDVG